MSFQQILLSQKWKELRNIHVVHLLFKGFIDWYGYSFIKYITRLCENDDYYSVSTGIVPILDKITSDKDITICVVALNQFGPIADVSIIL